MKFEDKVSQLRIKKHQGRETKEFLGDVVKMAQGEALEYLLGQVNFCGAAIDLSLRPMIPRPETEFWVRAAIREIEDGRSKKHEGVHEGSSVLRALDLFSGSGCVGLAVLKNIPESTVDFIEYDPALKKQIEISVEKNKIEASKAKVITGDTWNGATGLYDVILAVPPYVPPQLQDEVMSELTAETPLCFFDKEDGYYYHKQVLSHAQNFLTQKGILYLEFDITQRETIEQLAKEYGFTRYSFLNDPHGHECTLCLSV